MFSIDQRELHKALSLCQKAVKSKHHPVLMNVRMQCDGGDTVMLTTTDLYVYIEHEVPCNGGEPFDILVNCHKLAAIVGKLSGYIQFALDGSNIQISDDDGFSGQIEIGDSNEYPALPSITAERSLVMGADALLDGFGKVAFAASTEESKQVLCGVNIKSDGECINFAATDGHRLAVFGIDQAVEPFEVTVPNNVISLLTAYGDDGSAVTMEFDAMHISFVLENATIYGRLIEGSYPAYRQLIPQQFEHEFTINASEVGKAITRAMTLDDLGSIVCFEFTPTQLAVTSRKYQPSFGCQIVQGEFAEFTIGLNPNYIQQGLAKYGGVTEMKMNTPTSPCIFDQDGLLYLVMPIQLRD